MMNMRLIGTAALAWTLLGMGAAVATAPSASPASASDEQITREVRAKLSADMPFSVGALQVTTRDGVVTLSGRVDTSFSEVRALADAHGVQGVTKVRNELNVVS